LENIEEISHGLICTIAPNEQAYSVEKYPRGKNPASPN